MPSFKKYALCALSYASVPSMTSKSCLNRRPTRRFSVPRVVVSHLRPGQDCMVDDAESPIQSFACSSLVMKVMFWYALMYLDKWESWSTFGVFDDFIAVYFQQCCHKSVATSVLFPPCLRGVCVCVCAWERYIWDGMLHLHEAADCMRHIYRNPLFTWFSPFSSLLHTRESQ